MVQPVQQRFERVGNIRVVHEPAELRIAFAGNDDLHAKAVAVQPAAWVGPNQVAWFQFTIVAPSVPGTYRLSIRPLIEGAQWMEDYGVFWFVTVRAS